MVIFDWIIATFPLLLVLGFAALIAITVCVVVSLVAHREDFNMDRMLHRKRMPKVPGFEKLGILEDDQLRLYHAMLSFWRQ